MRRPFIRDISLVLAVTGVVYACSGTAEVSKRRESNTGGSAGDGSGGTGNTSAAGNGGSGNAINPTQGGSSGKGNTGGTSGSSARGGSAGGDEEGGFGDVPSFGGFPDVTFDYEPEAGGQGGACATETGQATLVKRPMDVIISIDNSESMAGEIQAVQARINSDFATIIGNSGIDYRVIMVSRYGNVFAHNYDGGTAADSAYSICIGAPLSSLSCPASSGAATPAVANNPPRFYHHSTDISSHNMWCALLDSYDTTDPISTHGRAGWAAVAPNGWKQFLRPEAYKVFIGITDDRPSASECAGLTDDLAGATAFDTALRALDPAEFQTSGGDRNYTWYSIVGMYADKTVNNAVLSPTDPVGMQCCRANGTAQTTCQGTTGVQLADSAFPGIGYQQLSIMTGGLRYPSCYNDNFNDIFQKIAEGVIEGAKASCVYDVPDPAHGLVDPNQTKVSYKPGSGNQVPLPRRASESACAQDEGFYYSDDFKQIHLCPTTCDVVQADPQAKVALDFGCLGS